MNAKHTENASITPIVKIILENTVLSAIRTRDFFGCFHWKVIMVDTNKRAVIEIENSLVIDRLGSTVNENVLPATTVD